MKEHLIWRLPFIALLLCFLTINASELPDPLPAPDGKSADMSKPVQVFVLMGQSNMLGFGKVSKLKGIAGNKYPYLLDKQANWVTRKDVRNVRLGGDTRGGEYKEYLNDWLTVEKGIGKGGKQIGPEIAIGNFLGEAIDAPVLILKICVGNRSLGFDLLPPSSAGYQGDNNKQPRAAKVQNGKRTWYAGIQYDADVGGALKALKDIGKYYPGAKKYDIAGFFFWQGAKDSGSAKGAAAYEKNLVNLIKDLRKDFNAPKAYFVCATMGQAKKGGNNNASKITDAQLAVDGKTGKYPEFKGNVATFYSNPVSKGGSANGHYGGNPETYMNVGEGMGQAMVNLLKKK